MMNAPVDVPVNKLVMVIDDSPTVRKIVEVSLRREGFTVVSYPDAIKFFAAVTENRLTRIPDLIILDIDLPEMNGYQIARYLKSKPGWRNATIIFLTRHEDMVSRLRGRMVGAKAYLTKPFTTQTILEVVRQQLQGNQ